MLLNRTRNLSYQALQVLQIVTDMKPELQPLLSFHLKF